MSYLHLGESVGTFGHGQFFQLPPSSTHADDDVPLEEAELLAGDGLLVGAGLFAGAGLLAGAGALAALTGAAKR